MIISASKKSAALWRWEQVSVWPPRYELQAPDGTTATISWAKAFGSRASAQWSSQTYVLQRTSLLTAKATIHREGEDEPLARFEPQWTGNGTIRLASGRELRWKGTTGFHKEYTLSEGQRELMHLSVELGMTKMHARFSLPADDPDGPVLACFCLYILVMAHADTANVPAAGGS